MNCQTVHDRLLDLVAGNLSPQEARAMLEHAERCDDCAAVLAVEEELQSVRSEGADERVPEELVASMWPRVRAELPAARRRRPRPGSWPARRVARAALAATLAGVLLGGGFLWGRATRTDDAGPVPRVPPRVEATARPAAGGVRVSEVMAALDRLPVGATVLSAERTATLLDRSRPLRVWVESLGFAMELGDGVQVEELRRLLRVLPQNDATTLPASLRPGEIHRWLERRV